MNPQRNGLFAYWRAPIKNTRFEIKLTGDEGAIHITIKGRLSGPYAGGTIVDRTNRSTRKRTASRTGGTDHCKATFHWAAEL
jgi:hypothetical protein